MALLFHPRESISVQLPSRDCEVFVSKIPCSVTEQELISMFEKYGEIFKLRLIRRGDLGKSHAYVRFTEIRAVRVAVLAWNAYEIREGQRITVCRSIENMNLVLCNIPKYLSAGDIYYLIRLYTAGLQEVHAHASRDKKAINSGLAVLKYESHNCAVLAKKILFSVKDVLWDRPVQVEWYIPGLRWHEFRPYGANGMCCPSLSCPEPLSRVEGNFLGVPLYQGSMSDTVVIRDISDMYMPACVAETANAIRPSCFHSFECNQQEVNC